MMPLLWKTRLLFTVSNDEKDSKGNILVMLLKPTPALLCSFHKRSTPRAGIKPIHKVWSECKGESKTQAKKKEKEAAFTHPHCPMGQPLLAA